MSPRERDGSNPVEQKALYRVHVELQALPASVVVQLALWPDKIADWAKDQGLAPAVVYNMLGNFKPYHRVRRLLARRLGVDKAAVDDLIERQCPEPSSTQPPAPPTGWEPDLPAPNQSAQAQLPL